MKTFFRLSGAVLMIAVCISFIVSSGCKKKTDNNSNDKCQCWNENWLIGTWEGTTPSTIQPFANKKIRIVFNEVNLENNDTVQGSTSKTWAYSGTFTWDVDSAAWSMNFVHTLYPQPGYDIIIWGCINYVQANITVNNVSIRIGDTIQVDPYHTIDLDWGPFNGGTGAAPTYIDLYGDIELDINGVVHRAEYPPNEGSMIRLTKK
ncbi:MAG: hypothetical protein NTX61_12020 [Bacteroidetes bacterium]|nr:hypothetical protein [Bacteroidota bacterium]